MHSWILIVMIAQLLYAVAALVDKFILTSKKVPKPFIYAFYVNLLAVLSLIIFIPGAFGLKILGFTFPSIANVYTPTLSLISMGFVAAFAGFHGLISLYESLRNADASDVVPVIGSISAVGTLVLSYLILDDPLSSNFIIAIGFLVLGTALISRLRFTQEIFLATIHAGLLFAIKATVIKKMFIDTSFDQAFFWSRIALIVFIVSLLLVPRYFGKISHNTKKTKTNGGLWVVGNAILGGTAAFMTLKAIDLGNVAVVQSMGGLQFVFLIAISFLFGRFIPKDFGENNTMGDIIQKAISISFIIIGFYFLFI